MTKVILISFLIISNCVFAASIITNETVGTLFEIILPYLRINRLQVFKGPKCFPDLGCFKNDGIFRHPLYRPISLSPEDPEKIGTRFFLYTRPDQIKPQLISKENISTSIFNPGLRTIIAVHGFYYDNYFGKYQIESFAKLRKTLSTKEDINYIFVDWGKGASTWYVQATANTRVVGAQIAELMKKIMVTYKFPKDKFWLIGHSLGAHVVGYVGSILKNISRITGLDPAKPYFVGMPVDVRLDVDDALFVDVIHTNAPQITHPFGFGTRRILGHIDFFPNGGNKQPGCLSEEIGAFLTSVEYGIQKAGICNHERSIRMFAESMDNPECEMIAYKCDSFSNFKLGFCYLCGVTEQDCAVMGKNELRHQQDHRYFLITNSEPPFCVHHYRIEMTVKNSTIEQSVVQIHADLIGNKSVAKGHSGKVLLTKVFAFLLTGDRLINNQNLILELFVKSESLKESINLHRVKITPMFYLNDKKKMKHEKTLSNLKIPINEKVQFQI